MHETQPKPAKLDYIVGLDLGPTHEPSALAVLERAIPPTPKRADLKREPTLYACRHLERWHPGSPYTAIVDRVVALFGKPPLRGSTLVIDQTGVGRAVVDLLRHAKADGSLRAKLFPVTITAHPRTPHLMCDARCPFCGKLMKLVSYFEIVELVSVEEC
jgi:hypothetical protein